MNDLSKRKHVLELNYIRAIAAFGIFAIHASGGFVMYSEFSSNAMKLGMVINQIFTEVLKNLTLRNFIRRKLCS